MYLTQSSLELIIFQLDRDDINWTSNIIELLTFLSALFTLLLAYFAFQYTKKEFRLHLEKEQSETLSHYNERYSSDENIKIVINYLLWDSGLKISSQPPINDFNKEMFLRFFEELQYAIEKKSLTKEIVYEMFAHYAIKAFDKGTDFVEDINEFYWYRFRTFAISMKKIDKTKNKKLKKSH